MSGALDTVLFQTLQLKFSVVISNILLFQSPFEDTDQPAWEVLRDDYMLGNDMADWDKLDNDEDKPVDNKKLKERKKKKIKKS